MAGITTSGIVSGIDTAKIIEQLMGLERRPVDLLTTKKTSFEAKISSYGSIASSLSSLKSSLSSLKSKTIFSFLATSSDKSVLTASASSSAAEGSYAIKVSNIATAQSIHSATFTSESDTVADLSTVTTQKLKISVGSSSTFTITVNSTNNTLAGLRDAINAAKGGVTASTLNDGSAYRLILSPSTTGASSRIVVQVDENNNGTFEETPSETDTTALSRLAFNATYDASGNVTGGTTNMTQSQAAVDASLVVNGLTITKGSNKITDIMTGVTLNLLKDSSGNTLTLNVSKDFASMTSNINNFVKAYNAAMGLVGSLSIPTEGGSAVLKGESAARRIMTSLRSTMTTSFSGKTLAAFGVTHDKTGVLSLDAKVLDKATSSDFQSVVNTFDSMTQSLEKTIDTFVKTLIPEKTKGLTSSMDRIDDRIALIEKRLVVKESSLRKQFTALEETISRLQASGDFLTQQLASISNISSNRRS